MKRSVPPDPTRPPARPSRPWRATDESAALERDPDQWVSGDDPMTPAQRSYLDTLAKEAGEELPADLTKAAASQHIERLKAQLGR